MSRMDQVYGIARNTGVTAIVAIAVYGFIVLAIELMVEVTQATVSRDRVQSPEHAAPFVVVKIMEPVVRKAPVRSVDEEELKQLSSSSPAGQAEPSQEVDSSETAPANARPETSKTVAAEEDLGFDAESAQNAPKVVGLLPNYRSLEAEWRIDALAPGASFVAPDHADRGEGIFLQLRKPVGAQSAVFGSLGFLHVNSEWRAEEGALIEATDAKENRFRLGFGGEYAVNRNLLMQADVSMTLYEGEQLVSSRLDPSDSVFRLGLAYRF